MNSSQYTRLMASLCAAACCANGQVVINEIHYDPPSKSDRTEFVELYNPGPTAVDLSGWRFTDGIGYTFPPGTLLPADDYLVVSEDPARLTQAFGTASLGPYQGFLSGEGEQIRLRNTTDAVVDEVNYGVGSPWPTASAGEGSSMELINPSLDNDLGGSWRASATALAGSDILLPAQSSIWRYRKGTSEASSPTGAWRAASFTEDGTWQTGRTSIGFGDADDNTLLSDMQGGYSSVFLRHAMVITNAADIGTSYRLRIYVDDGCIVWINGIEVARPHMTAGNHPYNSTAENHEREWEEFQVNPSTAMLAVGTNLLAIHAFNQAIGSSDFSIDAELFVEGGAPSSGGPSPGELNNQWSTNAPPQARQIAHSPTQPTTSDAVVITAKVTDSDGVQAVTLSYQLVLPGSYIPAWLALDRTTLMNVPNTPLSLNPAFTDAANWTDIPMTDNGAGADVAAGDNVFTAVIPAQAANRTLVRYRITVTDTHGASARLPYGDDPSLNYACYIYNGVPTYQAQTSFAYGTAHTYTTNDLTSAPVYHMLTLNSDLMHAYAYTGSYNDWKISKSNLDGRRKFNWECAFVYDGKVYDHVLYRLRQSNDRYSQEGKRPMRFRFNRGNDLEARDQFGRRYPTKWRTLNVVNGIRFSGSSNGVMPEGVTYQLFRMYGLAAPFTHMFQLRVVDGAEESDQYYGDFYGHYLAFEDFDQKFKDAHGMPDGNMYKLRDGFTDGNELKQAQGRFSVTDDADWDNIRINLLPTQSTNWLNEHVNYETVYRYHSVIEATRCYDNGYFGYGDTRNKNQMWFFNLEGSSNVFGRAQIHPHDTDSAWSPGYSSIFGDSQFRDSFILNGGKPEYEIELRNYYREFRDLVWQTDVVYPLIDEHARFVRELSKADQDRWNGAPADAGSNNLGSLQERMDVMRSIAFVIDYRLRPSDASSDPIPGGRAGALDIFSNEGGDATAIPNTPLVTYTGLSNAPVNGLTFACNPFGDPQGTNTFAAMQWRAGEITDTNAPAYDPNDPLVFEIDAAWESPVYASFVGSIQLPASAVREGHTYRVRVRMKDNTGRWSHWSPPAQFIAGPSDYAVALAESLRITEVMYHPPGGEPARDREYVELQNIGTNTLELGGVAFTAGIDFDFAPMSLNPGERILVVRDVTEFAQAYDTNSLRIAGEYTGRLADGGEQIRLRANLGGAVISEFTYNDGRGWPLSPDGAGHALVPKSFGPQNGGELDYGGNWTAGSNIGGSPGAPELTLPDTGVVINELAAHTDYSGGAPWQDSNDWIELFNRATTGFTFDAHWYLSDDPEDLVKWQLPLTSLASSNWIVFTEVNDFHTSETTGFGLNKAGEQLFLSHLPGGRPNRVVDAVRFKGQPNNATLGRFADGDDVWPTLIPTSGSANQRVADTVIIDELMYHPNPNLDELEYIEILNRGTSAISLWEADGAWSATWRIDGGVNYSFPSNTVLQAGERIALVAFDPANTTLLNAFLTKYGIQPGEIQLLGPYPGRLSNGGERVAIEKPQAPDGVGEPASWIIIDEVIYFDGAPWTPLADGSGLALQRKAEFAWGRDPDSWAVGIAPSPGKAGLKVSLESPANGVELVTPCTVLVKAVLDNRFVQSPTPEVEYFADGVSLGIDVNEPYETSFVCPETNTNYLFHAVLSDNGILSTTQVAIVTVYTNQPTVSLTGERILNTQFYNDLALDGVIALNGLPPHLVTTQWLQADGPGFASFADETAPTTTVTFSAPGEYTLLLITTFGGRTLTNQVTVSALDINLLNRLPYQESFESFDIGRTLVGLAGWYGQGSDEATIVSGSLQSPPNLPILDAPHERAMEVDQKIVNRFADTAGYTNIWIDTLVECWRWNGDTLPAIAPAEQFAVLINSNGHLMVWHDQGAQDGWTELTSVTVTNGQWARLTALADYTAGSEGFRLWVDGAPITGPLTVFDAAGTNLSAFSEIEITGLGAVDDIVVEDYNVLQFRKLTTTAGPHGSVDPAGEILVPIGGGTTITATASAYYDVDRIEVNGGTIWTGTAATAQYTFTNVVNRQSLDAWFKAVYAIHGVPHWWLAAANPTWTNNFDSHALGDDDLDKALTWQEYVAGTDPTNPASVFDIEIRSAATDPPAVDLVWDSVTGRTYTATSTTNLTSASWSTNAVVHGDGSEMSLRQPNPVDPSRHFRMDVQLLDE